MNTTATTDYVQITGGPSIPEVWDSAKYAHTRSFPVDFTWILRAPARPMRTIQFAMQVTGVEHEDGSGHSLLLTGYVIGNPNNRLPQGTLKFYYRVTPQGEHTGHLDLTPAS